MKTAAIICAACGSTFERAPGRGRPRKYCTACVPPVGQGRAAAARAWRDKTGYNQRYAAERRGSATARERNRVYYLENRAAVLERARRYREQHREVIRERARRTDWNTHGKSKTATGKWLKGARWALLKAPERLTERQQTKLAEVQAANRGLYRAYLLKEELRALYHLNDRSVAAQHLNAWLAWASRSKLKPFVKLARTIRRYREGILAAIRLRLSNARLEGLNSKVRLISHRSFGFHRPDPLIALIHLCAGGILIDPPFTTNS